MSAFTTAFGTAPADVAAALFTVVIAAYAALYGVGALIGVLKAIGSGLGILHTVRYLGARGGRRR